MLSTEPNRKIAAYALVALTVLVGAFHYWEGITMTSPKSGERIVAALMIIGCAVLIPFGSRSARISIGALFLFFAAIDSLIILSYVRNFDYNWLAIIAVTTIMAFIGYSMSFWKCARVFEEERERRITVNS